MRLSVYLWLEDAMIKEVYAMVDEDQSGVVILTMLDMLTMLDKLTMLDMLRIELEKVTEED